jgi:S1-C subfamily serine protease
VDLSWPPAPPPRRRFGAVAVLAASLAAALGASIATVAVVAPGAVAPNRSPGGFQTPGLTAVPVPTLTVLGAGAVPSDSPAAAASAAGSVPESAAPSATVDPVAAPSAASTATPAAADPNGVIVAVAARVSPAVVTITTDVGGTFSDPFTMPATGVGSGFIFDGAGWIMTNDHVIEGASTITVTLKGGRQLDARVVASDVNADLAVLKVTATELPTVQIGTSDGLEVGQLLIAIGSPLGTYSDSVTSGILSATGRTVTVADGQTGQRRRMTNMLQTDAAINPGNSGGPLLDAHGSVVGINSAVDQSANGIGFAIPIDAAKAIMEQAKKAG